MPEFGEHLFPKSKRGADEPGVMPDRLPPLQRPFGEIEAPDKNSKIPLLVTAMINEFLAR